MTISKQYYGKSALGVLGMAISAALYGQDVAHEDTAAIVEIVVTSALHRSRAETVLPVNILAGEELREKAAATLGEMLQEQVGVNNASFGVGVGLPVIRGQSANRVQVLQGGVGNVDASAVSPDHANSLEPALAQRIEVLRGPATLLYGNGAIGGVVNVIDNAIPPESPEGFTALLETRHNDVADLQTTIIKLEGGNTDVAWHVDAIKRDSNDTTIKGFAINPALVDMDDEEAVEELLNSAGRIGNSRASAESFTLGGSWLLDSGYIGMAYSSMDNEYGLPPGAHAHHDHGDEHDDEHEEEHEEHDEAHAEDEGDLRIVMEQQRWDVEGEASLDGFFTEIHGRLSVVDYQHAEVEADGGIGTVYSNEGLEGRLLMHMGVPDDREGVIGVQFGSRDFSALGEEAFIPATDIGNLALFTVQSIDRGDMTYEAGLRVENVTLDRVGSCDQDDTNFSGSLAAIWRYRSDTNLLASLNHSERAATVEERYSNIDANCLEQDHESLVAHAATQRLEIGNPFATTETSTNFELGWRKHAGNITGEFNLFYNAIDDFIYLWDTGLFEDDVEIARYLQQDAVFKGFESQLMFPLYSTGSHLSELALFADYVEAEFDRGGNVPRIPPLRFGFEWTHSHVNWLVKLRWTRVDSQSDLASNETASDGYHLLSLYGDYHLDVGRGGSLLLFARGNNLLDETIRNHTSLLKDVAPAPGRGVEVGLRLEF